MTLKQLFCYHKWIRIGKPYLWNSGMTKRVFVVCGKCGMPADVDLFDTPQGRWYK